MTKLIKQEKVSLKNHPEIKERWIQDNIAEDPTILGLGNLILKEKERLQPSAGRLDLLLQDENSTQRYEVEIQLGETDESHIIRAIEYWDVERKRYPQYEHTAVIVAENITSRFFNVIGLFNTAIPIIAIQMNAYKVDGDIALAFTTVLDVQSLGLVDEDEEAEITDRKYWINRSTEQTVKMADEVLKKMTQTIKGLELKYTKFYIGIAENGAPNNFTIFRPRKKNLNIEIKYPFSKEIQEKIDKASFDDIGYDKRWGRYRLRLTKDDIKKNEKFLLDLILKSYEENK